MKKWFVGVIVLMMGIVLCACGNDKAAKSTVTKKVEKKPSLDTSSYNNLNLEESTLIKDYKVALLSQNGVDEGMTESAKTGLERLKQRLECEIEYADYSEDNFDSKVKKLVKKKCKMIWVTGNKASDINTIASRYKDVVFAVADEYYDTIEENVVLINFKMSEASFLLGYIAGINSQSGVVSLEYVKNNTYEEYIYGYRAGVYYACNELDKQINLDVAEIMDSSNKEDVKEHTLQLIDNLADVIYVADSSIEKDVANSVSDMADIRTVGISSDIGDGNNKNALAYLITNIDSAVELVSFYAMSGNEIAGVSYEYGISEGAIDIKLLNTDNNAVDDGKLALLKELVIGGEFEIPRDEESFGRFKTSFEQ